MLRPAANQAHPPLCSRSKHKKNKTRKAFTQQHVSLSEQEQALKLGPDSDQLSRGAHKATERRWHVSNNPVAAARFFSEGEVLGM